MRFTGNIEVEAVRSITLSGGNNHRDTAADNRLYGGAGQGGVATRHPRLSPVGSRTPSPPPVRERCESSAPSDSEEDVLSGSRTPPTAGARMSLMNGARPRTAGKPGSRSCGLTKGSPQGPTTPQQPSTFKKQASPIAVNLGSLLPQEDVAPPPGLPVEEHPEALLRQFGLRPPPGLPAPVANRGTSSSRLQQQLLQLQMTQQHQQQQQMQAPQMLPPGLQTPPPPTPPPGLFAARRQRPTPPPGIFGAKFGTPAAMEAAGVSLSAVPTTPGSTSDEGVDACFSKGSVGHPHSCGGACRYVKRKGGCREGANCSSCHLCFWRRDADKDNSPATGLTESEEPPSVGSVNHPHACAAACKYLRRKGGCREGANCPNCHICIWRREKTSTAVPEAQQAEKTVSAAAAPAKAGATVPPPSGAFAESSEQLQSLINIWLANGAPGEATA